MKIDIKVLISFWAVVMVFLLSYELVSAQSAEPNESKNWKPEWLKKKEDFKINVKGMVQLWTIYSTNFEVFNKESKTYEKVDDRINTSLRRARVVLSGTPYERLQYSVALFYDQAGRDILSSGIGGTNKADPSVGIWDAFLQWKVSKKTETVNIIGGWFRPQVQRENITSGWSVGSFEKAMSQNYVRRNLVGTGPGRAAGLNLGGLKNWNKIGVNYNLGLFNPLTTGFDESSSGQAFSPLVTGRLVLTFGDPELEKYGISYETNFYNQRKGLSLDFNFGTQGKTDQFLGSSTVGTGFLFNYGALNMDGEWFWMQRKGASEDIGFKARNETGHVRMGVNLPAGKFILELTAMVMAFSGASGSKEQKEASILKMSSGAETTYDVGLNWYLDKKNLKLQLHYTFRDGDPGDAGDGAAVNAYFSQSGVGAIKRGNWLGVGLNAIF